MEKKELFSEKKETGQESSHSYAASLLLCSYIGIFAFFLYHIIF